MRGYLERLAANAITPGGTFYAITGSIYGRPSDTAAGSEEAPRRGLDDRGEPREIVRPGEALSESVERQSVRVRPDGVGTDSLLGESTTRMTRPLVAKTGDPQLGLVREIRRGAFLPDGEEAGGLAEGASAAQEEPGPSTPSAGEARTGRSEAGSATFTGTPPAVFARMAGSAGGEIGDAVDAGPGIGGTRERGLPNLAGQSHIAVRASKLRALSASGVVDPVAAAQAAVAPSGSGVPAISLAGGAGRLFGADAPAYRPLVAPTVAGQDVSGQEVSGQEVSGQVRRDAGGIALPMPPASNRAAAVPRAAVPRAVVRATPYQGASAREGRGGREQPQQREPDEIQIHIGRIEVTAVAPAPAARTQAAPMRKTPSLDDYLRRGNGRA